jgi:ribosomal protein L21E
MAVRQPRYSKEEFAQRGDALYQSEVRQQVEEGNHGKIVAIDIETGAFELADDTIAATDRLYERVPDAQPWLVRIGHRTVLKSLGIKMVHQRRHSKEELQRRGQELYESSIRQQVEVGNDGKIVAIDIETGEFEVDETLMGATDRLFERQPDAQPWTLRIGHSAVYHFGTRSLKKD